MLNFDLHWPPLVAAALLRLLLGLVWYSPMLFGRLWALYNHCTQREMRDRLLLALPFELLASLAIAFVLEQVLNLAGAIEWMMGLAVGLLLGLGYLAAATPNQVLYARRSAIPWLIDSGFGVASTGAMGVLLASWRWDKLVHAALASLAKYY